ncbi:hypothetical protein ACG2F4_01935 [Halalkalibaculum sp. DA3122]|uniref:hypothetical protein n=1 Tax=unclassified Halalkalibaculum TaxID=2964617 RepID=UPI003753FEC0
MDLEHKNKGHFLSSDSSDLMQPNQSSRLLNLFNRSQAPTTLIFIASILEIVLGVGVVFASVAGLMEPLWFSNFMCLLGSLGCMIGVFLLYNIIHKDGNAEELLREATRRIMNAQN